jgi:hypothetical protein
VDYVGRTLKSLLIPHDQSILRMQIFAITAHTSLTNFGAKPGWGRVVHNPRSTVFFIRPTKGAPWKGITLQR